ncbi:hypothetical protein RclHR1_04930006 [Rhizophagus clarus]|uniref:BTB/POZ domain-containing protein n=1 Tax=Rhizophagus clarus TaxID=94130 RepID=A0A2Z6SDQ5_9GLOM|nr:hypothetical protein RclHR1_04930006 [Rhizophagus clarus]GES84941.1 BTB/POZ domain-containing protein [Rhizophagus clarus]
MSHEYCQEVLNDFEKLLTTEIGYDVIIYAGENENMKELHAHSNILCARSQYFYAAFSNEWVEKKDGKFIFNKPNVPPQLFNIILRFIYCGKIDLTNLQISEILNLLISVDELNIHSLISYIQNHLFNSENKFLKQNPIEILETFYQHDSFTDFWDYCLEKFCEEPKILFESDKFTRLKAAVLELFLEKDNLDLEEGLIWDSLLKWGFAQNPSISQDPTKWSNEDVTIMKATFHDFIPLIKFYCISSEEFHEKVYPLKELLPKDLVEDLIKFHIAPNKLKCIYDSTIIERKQFAIFASWIDKEEKSHYCVRNIPYYFNLLYRASRDSYSPVAFHARCDNKGATLIVAKVTNSERIVGGYNPHQWDSSNTWKSTMDSFIYLFTDKNDIKTAKVSYSNGNQYSIRNLSEHGPAFGGGCDLYFNKDGNWHSGNNSYDYYNSYPKIDGIPARFKVDDYEVFQVIKK